MEDDREQTASSGGTATRQPGGGREAVATFSLLAALLFGGAAVGIAIGIGPGGASPGAMFVGFMTLPLVLGLTLSAWRLAALAWLFAGFGKAAWRTRGRRDELEGELRRSFADAVEKGEMPGTWVFLPVSAAVGFVVAVLLWLWASGDGVVAGAAMLVAAMVYGLGLRRLARRGLLPMPEE